MGENVVKIENLVKNYAELRAVDHLNLTIEKGEVFGLLGPNGSGKTTTISCLLSLLSYDEGSVELFGKPMTPTSYDIKAKIGVILQNVAVFEELNVYENIDFFCGLYITDKAKRKQYVDEAIEFVGLNSFTKFKPKKLSGGLLRRLNIACGIAHKPELIILDEPTVAVDPQSRNKILEGIVELNKNGATVIYTTHYMEEVEQICTKIAIMDRGKKIAEGSSDELKKTIKNTETVSIEMAEPGEALIKIMQGLPNVYEVTWSEGKLRIALAGGEHNLLNILDALKNEGTSFGQVYSERPTLNDVFLTITGKELRDKE
ncbi:MAG: ABC transporter ATP-binding protein [Lachnospiraceae bacterium]|nr:ABC transporter ATP-binding protein [Lachnospiraceae bacterium]